MLILLFSLIINSMFASNIRDIVIRGNKKITSDAIQSKIIHRKGDPIKESVVREEINNIFKLGYFEDIRVLKDETSDGARLIYEVKEKPIVSLIVFDGNSEVDSDDLKKQIEVKPYTVLNIASIKKSVQKLLSFYEEKGFYLATVKYDIKEAPKDAEVDSNERYLQLTFKISENAKIKVRKITFLGNKNIADSELQGIMQTKENGPFSFISSSGNYREAHVETDRDRIGFYYTMKGYPLVQVTGPITYVTPDKKWIYITYSIKEGDKYYFGEVNFKGEDLVYTDSDLRNKLKIIKAETYNSMMIREQIIEYQNMYGDKGYAFTNIVPIPSYDEEKKTVDLVFDIDKGRKVYFGEFTVVGNKKTRDKVLRRELRIHEGELYNYSKKELSRNKIFALGFFEDVTFYQYVPKGTDPNKPDKVNIEIRVKERSSTGQFMVSAGYSTYEKFVAMVQVQENNFLGRGQVLTLRAQLSKLASIYYLSFFDPYIFDTKWGWGLDIYRENRITRGFNTIRVGFNMRFSYPLTDFSRVYLTYKLEDAKTSWIDSLSNIFIPSVENGITSSAIVTLERDRRNNRLDPTDGSYQALNVEYAGLGGDKYFVKTIAETRLYQPFLLGSILRFRFLLGNIGALYGKQLPINQKFLMGGINDLRGFYFLSLGPQKPDINGNLYPVGGLNELLLTTELEFPILTEAGIRGVVFFDGGNSFNTLNSNLTTDVPLRANWGLGMRWHSPIGPLRFEWGVPFARRPGEDQSVFQFMIGPSF